MMKTANALELKDVSKKYPGFALEHISFTLPEGYILGLVGENGAGKSTTIKLILDSIQRDSGEIYVLGKDNRNRFQITKEDIGVVLDEAYFPESITAKQVNAVMRNTYKKWNEARFKSLLERFSLQGIFTRNENEAGHCCRTLAPRQAFDFGRSNKRAGSHCPR